MNDKLTPPDAQAAAALRELQRLRSPGGASGKAAAYAEGFDDGVANASSPEPSVKLPPNVTRYKVVQDKGEYCLKGCPDGDLVDFSAYAALLAKSSPEPVAWQPIETAPHGRKLILGYHNGCGNWRTVVGKYIKARTLELSDEALDRLDLDIEDGDDRCYAPEGWYETPDNAEFIDFTSDTPTHWMPLPTAPTKEAKP